MCFQHKEVGCAQIYLREVFPARKIQIILVFQSYCLIFKDEAVKITIWLKCEKICFVDYTLFEFHQNWHV